MKASFLTASAVALAGLVVSLDARAYSEGITGRTVTGCLGIIPSCHNDTMSRRDGATVTIEGPMSVMAGERVTYTLRVARTDMGALAGAGLDVAASGGALRAAGTTTRVTSCELTHNAVISAAMGASEVRIPFDFIAPASSTTVTIRAAGNAVDGNGSMRGVPGQTGDQWATAQLMVTVTGTADAGGVCPEPEDVVAQDASDASPNDALADVVANDGSANDAGSNDAATNDAATDARADGGVTMPPGGVCACSAPGRARGPSGVWAGALAFAAALLARRRRAR
jgi:hypothetical protein